MESWGGKGEGSVSASRHPSWDEEDDGVGGVWNSAGSQGSGSSFNSGGWGQSHVGKRGNMKVRRGEKHQGQKEGLTWLSLVHVIETKLMSCLNYILLMLFQFLTGWRWRQLDEPCVPSVLKHGSSGKML